MVTVPIAEIEKLLYAAAEKYVTHTEAQYFARNVLEIFLRKSPRVDALHSAILELETWEKYPDAKIEKVVDKGASALFNFNRLAPSVKLKWLHDEIKKRSGRYGVSCIGFYNTGGLDWLSLFTLGLARHGIIGICMFNGGPGGVIPYGGTDGFFGTNPISYAIPTNDEPILTDMATSEVPFFEYSRAKKAGRKLPRIGRVTKLGVPTDDPEHGVREHEARLLPMGGGYKGYALNLLVEVMTGRLVRSPSGGKEKSTEYLPHEYGGILMGIDVKCMTDISSFRTSMSSMSKEIRKQKPAKKGKSVRIPGDESYMRYMTALRKKTGAVDDKTLQSLRKLVSKK